jgi:hypothetical protein
MSQKETKKRGLINPNEPVIKKDFNQEKNHAKKDLVKLISNLNKLKKSLSLTDRPKPKSLLSSEISISLLKLDYQLSIINIRNQAQRILDYIHER